MEDVTKVSDLISNISKASDEQAQGVDQVNTAVSQMDQVTQQNASSAEESASASEELSAQAQAVKGIVDELAAIIGGTRAARGSVSSRRVPTAGTPSKPMPRRVTTSAQSKPPASTPSPANVFTESDTNDLAEF